MPKLEPWEQYEMFKEPQSASANFFVGLALGSATTFIVLVLLGYFYSP